MTAFLDQVLDRIRLQRTIQYFVLAGITCLALALRLYKLGEWSFWIDEVFTINAAEFVWDWPLARMPFNLLFIHYALNWFGVAEWGARIVPALIGTISVPILFFPIRKLFGPITAVITAILLAVSPWHLFWSQNARFYVLLMLFYNIGLLYTLIALEEKRPLFFVIGGLFLLLALREKFTAIYFVPVLGIYFLLLLILPFEKPRWLQWKTLLLIALPLTLYVFYDTYSYFFRGHSQILGILSIFVGNPIDSPARILILILFKIGIPIVSLASVSGLYQLINRSYRGLFIFVGAFGPVLLLIATSPFIFTVDRYALITLPAWLILVAVALDHLLKNSKQSVTLLALGVLVMLVADASGQLLPYYQFNHGNRLDWQNALAFVEVNKDDDDIIVTTRPEVADYYLQTETVSLRGADKQISPESVLGNNVRYWFIVDSEGVWDTAPDMKNWLESQTQLIDMQYLRVQEQMNLRIYRYEPPS